MHETVAFDLAVKTAFEMTNREDTLIIVTADHGHTMTMSGYQSRGSDIRGRSTVVYQKVLILIRISSQRRYPPITKYFK